jgi:hypothetical protein
LAATGRDGAAVARVEVGGDGHSGVAGPEGLGDHVFDRLFERGVVRLALRELVSAVELSGHAGRMQHRSARVGNGHVVGVHVRDARSDEMHDRVDGIA